MDVIVGKTAGFCFGVKRAVEGSLEEVKKNNKKVYCLGELVHNKEVIKNIESRGIKVISDIHEIKEKNVKLIIRAHGIDKKIYEEAKKKNLYIIDFTCPLVSKIHKIAAQYKENNYYIFLVGSNKHPEIIGTSSCCGKNYSIIQNEDEVENGLEKFFKAITDKLLLVVQTTFNKNKFKNIEKNIRKKLDSKVKLVVKNTICNATEQRQIETEKIAKEVEVMIIVGGKNSSNTRKLYEIAKEFTNTLLIETDEELNINEIKKYNKVGIMAGTSTPVEVINNVKNKIVL